ncbi:hypothetical protein [Aeromonas sobria]|uniref:hypothetical protein n=1 Tax=Aeromonas sobria TaxID=646 RepID=UPI000C6E5B6A|nr:hypothetical protein [Aeromonas sobria]PKQ78097.1 hypothetical protein CJF47_07395 [Aeromonas sobria]
MKFKEFVIDDIPPMKLVTQKELAKIAFPDGVQILEVPFIDIPRAMELFKTPAYYNHPHSKTDMCCAAEISGMWHAWPCMNIEATGAERLLSIHQECIRVMRPDLVMLGGEIHVNQYGNIVGLAVYVFRKTKEIASYWFGAENSVLMSFDELELLVSKKYGIGDKGGSDDQED